MRYRPSSDTKQHRLQSADPVRIACALPFTARPKPAGAQKRTALSGSPAASFATVSGIWLAITRTPDAAAAPTAHAFSP